MSKIEVLKNTFSGSILKQLLKYLQLVNWQQPRDKIIRQIEQVSPQEYMWVIGSSPAYFVQYQIDSAAILKSKHHVLIVWKPKYIEYPSMIKFPSLIDKKLNKMKIQVLESSTTLQSTNSKYLEFVQQFYGTYFYSDIDFDTNFVTYSKHFISKITQHSYWHAVLQDTGQLYITRQKDIQNTLKVRISGMKEGYDKTIYLFSYKGKRNTLFTTAKSKWMQVISFLAMILVFYAVVACPSQSTEGVCVYKQEMTFSGGGIMMALMGVRLGLRSSKKKKKLEQSIKTQ